jgi:hypothetical protein
MAYEGVSETGVVHCWVGAGMTGVLMLQEQSVSTAGTF